MKKNGKKFALVLITGLVFISSLASCKGKESFRETVKTYTAASQDKVTIAGKLEFISDTKAVVHAIKLPSTTGPYGDVPILFPESLKKFNGKNVEIIGGVAGKDVYDSTLSLTRIDSIRILGE